MEGTYWKGTNRLGTGSTGGTLRNLKVCSRVRVRVGSGSVSGSGLPEGRRHVRQADHQVEEQSRAVGEFNFFLFCSSFIGD